MVTFNNGRYIRQAIESVLIQETDFSFELIISDDCSTDNTRDIVEDLIENHEKGSSIRYYRHPENLTYVPNLIYTLKKCKAKYIAFLDSDDYWTDPLKLQKQFDFMEANPLYSICFHDVLLVDGDDNFIKNHLVGEVPNNEYSKEDILNGSIMPTATIFFRNCIKDFKEDVFRKVTVNGDTFLFTLLISFGSGKYLPSIKNSVRRIHSGGIWEGLDAYNKLKNGTNTYLRIYEVVNPEFKRLIASIVYSKLKRLVRLHLEYNNYNKFLEHSYLRLKFRLKYRSFND